LLVEVGRLVKAHGIKGDLLVASFTDLPEIRFSVGAKLYLADGTELTVTKSVNHSGNLILHFDQIDDRTKAELVSRNSIFADVDETELPPEPGRYFDRQLIGLNVITVQQQIVGKISEVLHLPAQDMFVVVDESSTEYLIPFVDPIVIEVDLEARTVLIDPPKGLLNLAEAEDAN
jgi:16S rRNA processing protein RimM